MSHQNDHLKDDEDKDWDKFCHLVKIIQIVSDLIVKHDLLQETIDKQIQKNFIRDYNNNNNNNKRATTNSLELNIATDSLISMNDLVSCIV